MKLSVVIPVYNEAENVAGLLTEITAALADGVEYEILFVDDASDDDTLTVLRQQRQPRLRIIRHASRAGQSAALCSGVAAARGEWIATLDGDGQNDPADIPRLLARSEEGYALIAGWRQQRRDSWLKRFSSRIANGVRSRLLRDQTPDTGCGLKLIRRELFMRLPWFNHMHRFLPALVLRAGERVCSVSVNHRPRQRGQSKYGLWNRLWVGIVDLFGVGWLQRRAIMVRATEVDDS